MREWRLTRHLDWRGGNSKLVSICVTLARKSWEFLFVHFLVVFCLLYNDSWRSRKCIVSNVINLSFHQYSRHLTKQFTLHRLAMHSGLLAVLSYFFSLENAHVVKKITVVYIFRKVVKKCGAEASLLRVKLFRTNCCRPSLKILNFFSAVMISMARPRNWFCFYFWRARNHTQLFVAWISIECHRLGCFLFFSSLQELRCL